MTREDFEKGVKILEAGIGRTYKKETTDLFWEETREGFGGAFLSVCRELARSEDRLPSLALLTARLSNARAEDDHERREKHERKSFEEVKARAEAAERVVGQSFEFFLKANGGDHVLAAHYFGQAYWEAKGNGKLATGYEHLILGRERFLADPKQIQAEREREKKKDIAERIKIGEAMDAAEAR